MESIIDTLFERNLTIYSDDSYSLVFEIIDSLAGLGRYDEKKSTYDTDGPTKRLNVVFNIVDELDKNSKIDIAFDIFGKIGKANFLEIKVEGSLITQFEEPKSVFAETFLAYYLRNVSQEYKKIAKSRMKKVDEIIVDKSKGLKRVYL